MSRHPGIRHFGFTQCTQQRHQPSVKKLDKGPTNANFSSLLGHLVQTATTRGSVVGDGRAAEQYPMWLVAAIKGGKKLGDILI
jgi:hypothetical protein